MQKAVGVNGLLMVLGAVLRDGSLRRSSALWRHLVSWLRDVADLLVSQQGTSLGEILGHAVSTWLGGTTDCCQGDMLLFLFIDSTLSTVF